MKHSLFAAAAMAAFAISGTAAYAEDCPVDVEDSFDLTAEQIEDIYACMETKLIEGYGKQDHEIGAVYRDWSVTATRGAVAGPHGKRILFSFVNDIGKEQYLKYEEENVQMPVGSVIAKESITISKKKKAALVGPLLIMTKLEAGAAPETGDWLYSGVQPGGKTLKVSQKFCHDCHSAFEDQDMLGYPLEEVRLPN